MANPEHLEILKQGVEAWNKWREREKKRKERDKKTQKQEDEVRPDLSGVYLHEPNLKGINLDRADLSAARLSGANMGRACLRETNLITADLTRADLSRTDLINANLTGADLTQAVLRDADLSETKLGRANLTRADLSRADLSFANLLGAILSDSNLTKAELFGVDLCGADLTRANLQEADLEGADLRGLNFTKVKLSQPDFSKANLRGADLRCAQLDRTDFSEADLSTADLRAARLQKADLTRACLQRADLTNSDLRYCSLVGSDLTETLLTGARLFGTARDDWIIKDVGCKYVYWDERGEQRYPKDRDLEPGEFERLYEALPTIEYIFEYGMSALDPLIMDRVVQAIRERQPEFDIKVDSINARGLAPSIKFTVQHEEHKEPALEEVRKEYEERLKRLEADKERLYDLFALAMEDMKYKDRLLEQKDRLLAESVARIGDTITTGPDSVVVSRSSNVTIQQSESYARELQKAIAKQPARSTYFGKITKRFGRLTRKKALDIIGGAIEDIAKGQVKEAAKQIVELGKDLGPLFVKMAPIAYEFFKDIVT